MHLFRSEMLPFHPPRYRSRIGRGLDRYGRAARMHRLDASAPAPASAHSARFDAPCVEAHAALSRVANIHAQPNADACGDARDGLAAIDIAA